MRRRSDGESVTADDVLDDYELAAYYRSQRYQRRPASGYERLSLGADPAVVMWTEAMGDDQ